MFDHGMKISEVSEYHQVPKMSVNHIFYSLHSAEHVNTKKRINGVFIFLLEYSGKNVYIYGNESIENLN